MGIRRRPRSEGGLSPADLPLEWGAGLILTGAGQGITQQATSLLNSLKDKWKRPDVQVLVVTPKVEATAKDLLLYYRQRVKEAGFVLATKGMAPSSGFVTIYALLQTAGYTSTHSFEKFHASSSQRLASRTECFDSLDVRGARLCTGTHSELYVRSKRIGG